jgi:peptidoglycan/xylan/chitin deacetylase (PgdA/CDA1 family)
MKKILRSIISTFFYPLGLLEQREGIVVLMYHRVNDALPANELVVSVAKFREQMEYLKRNCEVVGIEKLLDDRRWKMEDGRKEKAKSKKLKVVITFDDGYRDNYINAYPILKELGLPATIFLITGMIGTDQKRPRYKDLPTPDMMSWEEVREMAENGVSFGPHTVTHPHLSQLNYEKQRDEIIKSIAVISPKIAPLSSFGTPFGSSLEVTSFIFCYPYGDYNADTLRILKELGVRIAFTVKPGINNEKTIKRESDDEREGFLQLRRTEISGVDTLFDFKKKLAGAFDVLHSLVQQKKVKI